MTLTLLGIELEAGDEAQVPEGSLEKWLNMGFTTKRQLQSIIGKLSDAATVVRPGSFDL